MKLPNADRAVIPREKLQGYLLSSVHPLGKFKAAFFRSLGYNTLLWKRLEKDFRSILGNDAKYGEQTDYGQKFEVRGRIVGPTGKAFFIVTVWIVLTGEDFPRFITAFPGEEN